MATTLTIAAVSQIAKVRFSSMSCKLNTLDLVLIDPSTMPLLGDAVAMTNPTWSGTVASVGTSDPVDKQGHVEVKVAATNTVVGAASAAPWNLSDTPNGSTTYGYRALQITNQQNTDGTTSAHGSCIVNQTGLWPAMTFTLTSTNQSQAAANYSITNVTVTWPGNQNTPEYLVEFGDPIVTMEVWIDSAAATAVNDTVDFSYIKQTIITAGGVTTPMIAAGAINAGNLTATLILATLIASASSGARYELDHAGFRAYSSSDDLLVNIPTDGSPVYVNAVLEALSLTVTGNAILQGAANEVAASAVLQADGAQGGPTQAPTLASWVDGVTLPVDTGGTEDGAAIRWGLDYDAAGGAGGATKVFYTTTDGGGAGPPMLLELKASDRTVNRSIALNYPTDTYGGVARFGSYLYVSILHPVSNGAGVYQYYAYVERYLQSTLAFDARYGPLTGLNSSVKRLTITNWGSSGQDFELGYYNNSHTFQGWTPILQKGVTPVSAAIMQGYLRTLTGDGGLTVSGTTDAGPFTITFSTLQAEWSLVWQVTPGSGTTLSTSTTSLGGWGDRVPAIAADASNIYLIAQNDLATSHNVKWNVYNATMVKQGATVDTTYAPAAGALVVDADAGNFDLGAARVALLFSAASGAAAGTVQTFTTAGAVQVNEPFAIRTAPALSGGLTYGDALADGARFWSYAQEDFHGGAANALGKHSTWTWTTASSIYWCAYSWYDSNATGGTHETTVGPRQSITLSRRRKLKITTQAIPGGTGNDYPNNARIYILPNASDPGIGGLKLQATTASMTTDLSTYNSGGAADPGSNNFPSSGAPGVIKSQQAGWTLRGDGSMALGGGGFPAGPTTNDSFYRTDLGLWFYYDGTRWLSATLFSWNFTEEQYAQVSTGATLTGQRVSTTPPLNGGSDIWLVQHISDVWVVAGGTALGASHNWVGSYGTAPDNLYATSLSTVTINSGASGAIHQTINTIGALMNNGTPQYFIWRSWTKTGTPGNILFGDQFTYRIVAT